MDSDFFLKVLLRVSSSVVRVKDSRRWALGERLKHKEKKMDLMKMKAVRQVPHSLLNVMSNIHGGCCHRRPYRRRGKGLWQGHLHALRLSVAGDAMMGAIFSLGRTTDAAQAFF